MRHNRRPKSPVRSARRGFCKITRVVPGSKVVLRPVRLARALTRHAVKALEVLLDVCIWAAVSLDSAARGLARATRRAAAASPPEAPRGAAAPAPWRSAFETVWCFGGVVCTMAMAASFAWALLAQSIMTGLSISTTVFVGSFCCLEPASKVDAQEPNREQYFAPPPAAAAAPPPPPTRTAPSEPAPPEPAAAASSSSDAPSSEDDDDDDDFVNLSEESHYSENDFEWTDSEWTPVS